MIKTHKFHQRKSIERLIAKREKVPNIIREVSEIHFNVQINMSKEGI